MNSRKGLPYKYFASKYNCLWQKWDDPEANSVEINPNITAELNDLGELIGLEITNASSFIRDSILESTQGKILNLSPQ
jgi:uncharacterized protein YuzE